MANVKIDPKKLKPTKKKKEFKILRATTMAAITDLVNEAINENWRIQGITTWRDVIIVGVTK